MSANTEGPEAETTASPHSVLSNRTLIFIWTCLVLALFAYYFPCLSGRADFYTADTCYFFEPFCRFAGSELRQGRLPLWNPLLYCGMSQLAMPSPSILYPPSYFLFLAPFSQGLSLYMIFHQLTMAVGSYLLARQLKASRQAALFVAISAGLMSYAFSLTRNPTLPATAAWLPLALFLQRKISLQRGLRQLLIRLATALAVTMIIGAGRPEVFLPCIAILFVDGSLLSFCSCIKEKTLTESGKRALVCAGTIILGLGMAGPFILPALEWISLSPRSHGLAESNILDWSANWFDFLSMVYANPMGDLCNDLTVKGIIIGNLVMSKHSALPLVSSAYVGPITVSLAFFAFCSKTWRQRGVFLACLIFACVLCAGRFTPVAPLLLKLFPILAMIRYPVKLLVFPVAILAWAAAAGYDLILSKQIPLPLVRATFVFWLVPVLLALLVFACPCFHLLGAQFLSDPFYVPFIREANLTLAGSLLTGGLIGMALVCAVYLLQKDKIKVQFFSVVTLVALELSLFASANSCPFLTAGGFYNESSRLFTHLSRFLEEDAMQGVKGRILPFYLIEVGLAVPVKYTKKGATRFQERFFGYARSLGVPNTTVDFGLPQSFGYEASATEKFNSFFQEAKEYGSNFLDGRSHPKPISDRPVSRFCKLTATRYLLTQQCVVTGDLPLPVLDDRYFELFGQSDSHNSRIYRVINPHPRIFFAGPLELTGSWDELKHKLCDPGEIPFDSKNIVFLLKSAESQALLQSLAGAQPRAEGSFSLALDDGQSLRLSVETGRNELLVISDQDYPGWQAELDGRPVAILNVNLFARAVLVPAGKHLVSMRYCPASLTNGASLAAVSLLLLLVLSLVL